LVPEFQSDPVAIRDATVVVENPAACGIGARENQLAPCHPDQPSCPFAPAVTTSSLGTKRPMRELPSMKHNVIAGLVRKKKLGIASFIMRLNGSSSFQ
jgi:hypothetical protein